MQKRVWFIVVFVACVALAGVATAQTPQNVHGTVQSVSGTTLTVKADDGRVLTVNMAAVGENIQKAMAQGMGVTIAGHPGASANQFTAQFIQQDSSAGQPAASPGK